MKLYNDYDNKGDNTISYFAGSLKDIFFPDICSFCSSDITRDTPVKGICAKCLCTVPVHKMNQRYITCIDKDRDYFDNDPIASMKVMSACEYDGPLKKAIVHFKFYEAAYYKRLFAGLACYLFESEIKEYDFIIPIPLYKGRLKERGYNQAELIAREISVSTGVDVLSGCLVRQKNTLRQSETKGREERTENLSDAFNCINPGKIASSKVLLLDDVLTSGATMYYAACELQNSVKRYLDFNKTKDNCFCVEGMVIASKR